MFPNETGASKGAPSADTTDARNNNGTDVGLADGVPRSAGVPKLARKTLLARETHVLTRQINQVGRGVSTARQGFGHVNVKILHWRTPAPALNRTTIQPTPIPCGCGVQVLYAPTPRGRLGARVSRKLRLVEAVRPCSRMDSSPQKPAGSR